MISRYVWTASFSFVTTGINADKRAGAFAVCRVAAVVVALSPYFTSTFRRRVLSTTRADTSMELEPALVWLAEREQERKEKWSIKKSNARRIWLIIILSSSFFLFTE